MNLFYMFGQMIFLIPTDFLLNFSRLLRPIQNMIVVYYLKDARKKLEPGHEFGYFDLITEYINNGGRVVAKKINANAYIDTGDKLAWLKAQMLYAVKDKD